MEKSRARVICNPTSGGGSYDPDVIREELEGLEVEWVETKGPEDAIDAAQDWQEGLLIVAGGDGTINDVVNGLGRAGFPEGVTLGILPAGTGNDLAATLCIPEDPELAEDVIRQNRERRLDVARVRSEGIGERFFINVATGGLGGGDLRRQRRRVEAAVGQALLPSGFAGGRKELRSARAHDLPRR